MARWVGAAFAWTGRLRERCRAKGVGREASGVGRGPVEAEGERRPRERLAEADRALLLFMGVT